jgi:hypothetical protein
VAGFCVGDIVGVTTLVMLVIEATAVAYREDAVAVASLTVRVSVDVDMVTSISGVSVASATT